VIVDGNSGRDNRSRFRVRLVVLAGLVAAVVWEFQGSAEVAVGAAALALQLVDMMRDPL
jgi:hypothetical protein